MNKWFKNLLVVFSVFSFSYYAVLAILDGNFLGITLLWPILGLISILLVILDCKGKFKRPPKAVRIILWILISLFGIYCCFNLVFICAPKEKITADEVDYIILLGGGMKLNGDATKTVAQRLDAAADLWKGLDNKVKIVVSGGSIPPSPYAESIMMERELLKRGIPEEYILQEDQARDTIQNLIYSARILSEAENLSFDKILNSNIVIVSSDYHLSRSMYIAHRLGYKNVRGFGSTTSTYVSLNSYLREILAVGKLQLRILLTGNPGESQIMEF